MYSCAQAAMIYEFTKQQWPVNNITLLQRKSIDFLISLDISLFLLNLYFLGPTAFSPSTWSVHPVKATTITKTLPGISGFLLECTQRSCKFRVRYSKVTLKSTPKLHKFASKTKTKMAKILHYQCQICQICRICIFQCVFRRATYCQVECPWKDFAKCSSDALVLGQ